MPFAPANNVPIWEFRHLQTHLQTKQDKVEYVAVIKGLGLPKK